MSSASDASKRTTFDLTYTRAHFPRTFFPDGITGPVIHCARTPGDTQAGDWFDTLPEWNDDDVDWIGVFFRMAVGEAVHEALEWFQVDGEPLLDPHRERHNIEELVDRFAGDLYQLAREVNHGS